MQNLITLDNQPIIFFQDKPIHQSNSWIWLQILAIIPVNLLANWLMGTCLICDWYYIVQLVTEMTP